MVSRSARERALALAHLELGGHLVVDVDQAEVGALDPPVLLRIGPGARRDPGAERLGVGEREPRVAGG
jgi:hypothetical protein